MPACPADLARLALRMRWIHGTSSLVRYPAPDKRGQARTATAIVKDDAIKRVRTGHSIRNTAGQAGQVQGVARRNKPAISSGFTPAQSVPGDTESQFRFSNRTNAQPSRQATVVSIRECMLTALARGRTRYLPDQS